MARAELTQVSRALPRHRLLEAAVAATASPGAAVAPSRQQPEELPSLWVRPNQIVQLLIIVFLFTSELKSMA